MSTTIDQRVVGMQFDNTQFEQGVQTSLSTLEKLKSALNFGSVDKGFDNLASAANGVNMSGLGSAVEQVSMKFKALEVIGVAALFNITNSVMNTSKRMIKALTIDPIKTGLNEYETKIGSIQTIMSNTASKGTKMSDVIEVIDELNLYADKTIYNFAEMTRNIGTFTAAGVGLREAASAIQGIANLAAASGSNSQQASTAMYQLSQALASGTVKLMDWNSVVNAGMGGEKFQLALKATAREHGIAVDDIVKKEGSFRESLKHGWISAEILNETLNKFTIDGAKNYAKSMMESGKWTQAQADALIKEAIAMDDAATKVKTFTQLWATLKENAQSGWGKSWEIIIGNFEEAPVVLTEISKAIGGLIDRNADARNSMLDTWKSMGGRTALIDAVRSSATAVAKALSAVKLAWIQAFPAVHGRDLANLSKVLQDFASRGLAFVEENAHNVTMTFKGLFMTLDTIRRGLLAVVKAIFPMAGGLDDVLRLILNVTGGFGEFLVKMNLAVRRSESLRDILALMAGLFGRVASEAKAFGDTISGFIFPGVEQAAKSMDDALNKSVFIRALTAVWTNVTKLGSGIIRSLGVFASELGARLGQLNFGEVFNFLGGISLGAIAVAVVKFLRDVKVPFEGIKDLLDGVRGTLETYQQNLQSKTLMTIAMAIGLLAASLLVLSMIDGNKLAGALGAITVLFVEMIGAMTVLSKTLGKTKGMTKAFAGMIAMSASILVLATALKVLGSLDFKQLSVGLVGVGVLMSMMVVTAKEMSRHKKTVIKGAASLVIFATAIKVLASAVSDLSALKFGELAKGLIGVLVLLSAVSLFLSKTSFSKGAFGASSGILVLAAAMKVLASAVSDFASMSGGELTKGIGSIATLLVVLAGFSKTTANAKHVVSTAIGLTILAAAIKVLASAVSDLSVLKFGELAKGIGSIATLLVVLAGALRLLPKSMMVQAAGLVVVGAALNILASALVKMGSMKLSEVGKGLLALGGSLGILAIALVAMSGSLVGAGALMVAAGALAVLAPVLVILSAIPLARVGTSLLLLAGAFTVIGVAGALLTPVVPTLLGLAAAFGLVGVAVLAIGGGMLAAGAGVTALAAGITALAAAMATGVTVIVAGVSAIIMGVVSLIPTIAVAIGKGLVEMVRVIGEAAPAIGSALIQLVSMLVDVLVSCVPKIVGGVWELIKAMLTKLRDHIKDFVKIGFDIVIGIMNGISEKLPELTQAGFDLIISLLDSLASAIENNAYIVVKSMGNLGTAMIKGLVRGITDNIKDAVDSVKNLGSKLLGAFADRMDINSPSKEMEKLGKNTVEGLVVGLEDGVTPVERAATKLAEDGIIGPIDDAVDRVASSMDFGGDILRTLLSQYGQLTNGLGKVSDIKAASSAITAYGKKLYEQSEQYKQDTAVLEDHIIELLELEDVYKRLASSKQTKEVQNDMASVADAIASAREQIIQDEIMIAQNTADTFNNMRDSISDAVRGFLDPLRMSLNTQVNLFEKFDDETTVIVEDLLANMESQTYGVKKWNNDLNKLAEKGFARGLIEQLREMGPSGAKYVSAFTSMTTSEMDAANNSFMESSRMTADTLIRNFDASLDAAKQWASDMLRLSELNLDETILRALGEMGVDGGEYVSAFLSMSPDQVAEFNRLYEESLSLPESVSARVIASFVNAGSAAAEQFAEKIKEVVNPSGSEGKAIAANSMAIGATTSQSVSDGLDSNATKLSSTATNLGKSVYDGLNVNISEPKGRSLGRDMAAGIIRGLEETQNAVRDAAVRVAQAAYAAAAAELGIASPSREFAKLGMYATQGFARGMWAFSSVVESASRDVGDSAMNSLAESISKMSSLVSSDVVLSPVVRPVMDLSEIQNGVSSMSDMVSKPLDVSANVASARMISKSFDNARGDFSAGGNFQESNQFSFVQNNYSPKALSRLDIYRQTKNQFSLLKLKG